MTTHRVESVATQVVEHDPLLGVVLHGYRLDSVLGRGRAAIVYRARHEVLHREAAIKILARDLAVQPEQLERFRREAQALSAMHHPNIVEVFDFGTAPDGRPFLSMELLNGRTLASEIDRNGPVGIGRFVEIARQLASGLAEAHRRGLVHRDLKPNNIMLVDGPAGEVAKILDFGIVRFTSAERSQLTDNDLVLGTPRYMAPEQVVSPHDAGPRSDLYALGVILYEMLTGRAPFDGSLMAVLEQQLHGVPPPMGTQTGFEPLIGSLLQKNPEDRPPTAEALLEALGFVESLLRRATEVEIAPEQLAFPEQTEVEDEVGFGGGDTVEEVTILSSEASTQLGMPISWSPAREVPAVNALPFSRDTVLSPAPEATETALDLVLNPELMNRPLHPPEHKSVRGPDETRVICEEDLASPRIIRLDRPMPAVISPPPMPSPLRPRIVRPPPLGLPAMPPPRPAPLIQVETSDYRSRRLAGALGFLCCALLVWLFLALHRRAPVSVEAVQDAPLPAVFARPVVGLAPSEDGASP